MKKHIQKIQTMLKEHGHYEGDIDGIVGRMTVNAVAKVLNYQEPEQQQTETNDTTSQLSQRDYERLTGVDKRIVKLLEEVSKSYEKPFMVVEGLRTKERQKYLMKKGATRTMNSRHLTGHAVDIAPVVGGTVSWDWEHYYPLAKAMKEKAKELNIPIEWGGDWKSFKDAPHWQLSWNA